MRDLRRRLLERPRHNYDAAIRALTTAGVTVPPDVANAQRAISTIQRARAAWRRPVAATPEDTAEAIFEAALAGDPLPDDLGERAGRAYLATQASAHAERAWALALDRAQATRDMAFNLAGRALFTGPLRQRLNAVMWNVTRLAEVEGLAGLDPDDPDTLVGNERVLSARSELVSLAEQYDAIREAQVQMRAFMEQPKVDTGEWYAETLRAESLFAPEVWATQKTNYAANLGPTRRLARLVWLATSGVGPWLPTPEEQDNANTQERRALIDEREAAFQRRVAEAAADGKMLVREGPTQEQLRAAERAARARAEALRSR